MCIYMCYVERCLFVFASAMSEEKTDLQVKICSFNVGVSCQRSLFYSFPIDIVSQIICTLSDVGGICDFHLLDYNICRDNSMTELDIAVMSERPSIRSVR